MMLLARIRALVLLGVAIALPQPGLAETDSKCKLAEFAKLPVVMEGERASLPITINGKPTRIWLDSGAFFNFMPKVKAVELGLKTEALPPGFTMHGIGGGFTPELARVRDFGILGVQLHNMEFVVGGNDTGNGFLGANVLGVFTSEFDLAKGAINWFKEVDCSHTPLAYWSAGMFVGEARLLSGQNSNDRHIYVEVMVNGHSLRAMLDTGAPTSIINLHPAQRAGIDMKSPQVLSSMKMGGVGSRVRQTWIARVGTFNIGGEEIRNTPIHIIDDSSDSLGEDMLLGVDFLMAHHVLVSLGQHKMFLTYNGGPIFSVTTDRETGHIETRSENMGAAEQAKEPITADEFAGRGSARLLRNDTAGAIADFTDAIKLAPDRADLLVDRAKAHARANHPALAEKDINAALVITPADHSLLTRRAQIKLGKGDKAGALADADAAAAATPKGSLDIMPVVGLYERLGKADRALGLLDPVIDLHRESNSYMALLNTRSWNRGLANADLDHALADSNTAIRRAGPVPAFLDTRALIQLRRKDYAAAIADASAALKATPKLAPSLFFRGLARIATGDGVGGRADIADARAIRPTIDQQFADYGLVGPIVTANPPAQPSKPDGDDDDDQ